MSLPVETMDTTAHPSEDFSVSFVASEAGSYEEALTLMNSGMARTLPRKMCRLLVTSRPNVPVVGRSPS